MEAATKHLNEAFRSHVLLKHFVQGARNFKFGFAMPDRVHFRYCLAAIDVAAGRETGTKRVPAHTVGCDIGLAAKNTSPPQHYIRAGLWPILAVNVLRTDQELVPNCSGLRPGQFGTTSWWAQFMYGQNWTQTGLKMTFGKQYL